MAIETIEIAHNRYAPEDIQSISLYDLGDGKNLTFGQLIAAVCLQLGAVLEAQSIKKMNTILSDTDSITLLSGYVKRIVQGDSTMVASWSQIRNELIRDYSIASTTLPTTIETYDDRMTAINEIKVVLDKLTKTTQEDEINLQSLITRRDVAINTSTNIVYALGTTSLAVASNY